MDGSRQMLELSGCREKGDGEEGSFKDSFLKIAHDASATCMPLATLPCLTATEAWTCGFTSGGCSQPQVRGFMIKEAKGKWLWVDNELSLLLPANGEPDYK